MDFRERSAKWYDIIYGGAYDYLKHYTESRYYFLWSVVSDRMRGFYRVLDLGCGTGQFASLLFDRGFKDYTGIDFSPVAIKTARKCCPGFKFVIRDLRDSTEFKDYECVVALEFLEHIENDLGVVSQIKPGAHFLGTVPSFRCESHVRAFSNADKVARRYGEFFNDFTVDTFLMAPNKLKFYLIEGVRNEQTCITERL